ncbi:MAG TPA: amidohydrolase family protein [Sandaracinaceae bacterium LLY-WYZ-13_1]|nr:amidohydrolase family protein [Sandaracinaceae bacterium LLY-WYZ-13_1]
MSRPPHPTPPLRGLLLAAYGLVACGLVACGLVACGAPAARRAAPSASPDRPGPEAVEPRSASTAPAGVDAHMHLGRPEDRGEPATGAEAVAALDEAGLARGVVLSPGYRRPPACDARPCPAQRAYTEEANDWTLREAADAAGRLLPFCGVPWMASWSSEEAARCEAAGARGLKLHQVEAGVSLRDEAAAEALGRLLDAAAAAELPVLIHVRMDDASEVRAFFAIAAAHPDARVIAAHQIAPSFALLPEAPENVWIEVSGLPHAAPSAGDAFVPTWRAFGLDRVLLGSDFPSLSPRAHLAMLEAYPLSDEERRRIVVDNPRRLFGAP